MCAFRRAALGCWRKRLNDRLRVSLAQAETHSPFSTTGERGPCLPWLLPLGAVRTLWLNPRVDVSQLNFPACSRRPTQKASRFAFCSVAATLALYYPVNGHPFANYDDADYVFDNFHVEAGLHWSTVTWAFTPPRPIGIR